MVSDTEDHPRSRGDHGTMLICFHLCSGSPPLTRGPQLIPTVDILGIGITPAHAGTTNISFDLAPTE